MKMNEHVIGQRPEAQSFFSSRPTRAGPRQTDSPDEFGEAGLAANRFLTPKREKIGSFPTLVTELQCIHRERKKIGLVIREMIHRPQPLTPIFLVFLSRLSPPGRRPMSWPSVGH